MAWQYATLDYLQSFVTSTIWTIQFVNNGLLIKSISPLPPFSINVYASAALREFITNCMVFRWVEFGHPCHMLFTYTRILVTTQSFHPGDFYALHISVTHSSLWYTPREIKLVLVWVTLPCACDEILPSSASGAQLYDAEQFPFYTVPSPSYRIPHNKNTAVFRAILNSIVAHIQSFPCYCEMCICRITA
jgi:hypothetical protein